MSDLREQFIELCERADVDVGDSFDTARVAQQLEVGYSIVDDILQGCAPEDAVTDEMLTKLCVVVAAYEANKRRYKEFKKSYGSRSPASKRLLRNR